MGNKRILWVGEATFLNSGYAEYGRELLKRLHGAGYQVAELGAYGHQSDPRAAEIPWQFFGNMPEGEEGRYYNAEGVDQFGKFKFEEVCAKYKPTHVLTATDYWMSSYVEYSPFRPFYSRVFLLPVDSVPQKDEWVNSAVEADAFLTYTDWAGRVIDKQSNGRAKWFGSAPGGVEMNLFRQMESSTTREKYGLNPEAFIVGMVGRNQTRKLFPELMEGFSKFLKKAPPELAKRSFLYLHSCWPDVGWDFPSLLHENGLSSKVLFTYKCNHCGAVYPAFFQDTNSHCKECHAPELAMPGTADGISREQMAEIYNLFDLFIQCSSAEGIGLCQLEAAACGVPIMSVDYSAMSEVIAKLNGLPIPVKAFHRDPVMQYKRAIPDVENMADLIFEFSRMPKSRITTMKESSRGLVADHYDWDKSAQKWMSAIDRTPAGPKLDWYSPARYFQQRSAAPDFTENKQFIEWCLVHIAGRPELRNSFFSRRLLADLNRGLSSANDGSGNIFSEHAMLGSKKAYAPFTRKDVVRQLIGLGREFINAEKLRIQYQGVKIEL